MAMVVKVAVALVAYVCLVVLVFSLMRVSALADRRAGRVEGADGRAPRGASDVSYRID